MNFTQGEAMIQASNNGYFKDDEVLCYKYNGQIYVESFRKMWQRLSDRYEIKHQYLPENPDLYMETPGVQVFSSTDFIDVTAIYRAVRGNWSEINTERGISITCTSDSLIHLRDGSLFLPGELHLGDPFNSLCLIANKTIDFFNIDKAWLIGCLTNWTFSGYLSFVKDKKRALILYRRIAPLMEKYFGIAVKKNEEKSILDYAYSTLTGKTFKTYMANILCAHHLSLRQIPHEIFRSLLETKQSFLYGLIDGSGYWKQDDNGQMIIQLLCPNKEFTSQLSILLNQLQIQHKIFTTKDDGRFSEEQWIKNTVEFPSSYIEETQIHYIGKTNAIHTCDWKEQPYDCVKFVRNFTKKYVGYNICTALGFCEINGLFMKVNRE